MKFNRLKVFRKLQIIIALILACSFVSSCSAPGLKTAGEKPLYHVYLTFDDGPLEGSEDVDNAVKTEKIKINVFVVGSYIQIFPPMDKYFQLYENNPYIEIGNHSFSHAHNEYALFYKDTESAYQDFVKNENVLKLKAKLARLPGRNIWRIGGRKINDEISGEAVADLLAKNGYSVFGWDIEWEHDARTGKPVQAVNDIFYQIEHLLKHNKTVTKNHIVILCHDEMFRKKWEETELKQLIERLRWMGMYEFNHLSEYPTKQESGK